MSKRILYYVFIGLKSETIITNFFFDRKYTATIQSSVFEFIHGLYPCKRKLYEYHETVNKFNLNFRNWINKLLNSDIHIDEKYLNRVFEWVYYLPLRLCICGNALKCKFFLYSPLLVKLFNILNRYFANYALLK